MNKPLLASIIVSMLTITGCTSNTTPSPTPVPVSPSPLPTENATQASTSANASAINTANWKQYQSAELSVNYPPSWVLKKEQSGINIYNPKTITTEQNNGSGTYQQQHDFFNIQKLEVTQTPKEYVNTLIKTDPAYLNYSVNTLNRKTVTISGKPAEMIKEEGEGAMGNAVYVSNGKVLYHLSTSATTIPTNDEVGEIIATFKLK